MKRPKLVRPNRSCRHHLRPKRPKRSLRLDRRFKRRVQGAGLNNQKKIYENIKISRTVKVEPSHFLQTPNVTSGVASIRVSFKERRIACAFVRNDYIGAHVSLREHMSTQLLKRCVLSGSYLLLTEGFITIPIAREIVSLCLRFWPSVLTRQNKPLWLLSKRPPVYLLKTQRPSPESCNKMKDEVITQLHDVFPQEAIRLLSSLSTRNEEFWDKAQRFTQNMFEALSEADSNFEGDSDSELYSDENGYSSDDLEGRRW